jgi:protein MpaA
LTTSSRRSWRSVSWVFLAFLAAIVVASAIAEFVEGGVPTRAARLSPAENSSPLPSPPRSRLVRRTVRLGRSVQGRPITASEIGDPSSRNTILVVGCIHGSEPAGIPVVRDLLSDSPPRGVNLWVIADLNPDGVVARTRQNARGVDLNRNFPWRWQPIGAPAAFDYSGPGPLSEPESRAVHALILGIHPRITIWFHQDEALVDESGGSVAVEGRYARLVGLPLKRLPRYPGSAAGWENHHYPGTTAFVVELPPGALSSTNVERFADAVLELSRAR